MTKQIKIIFLAISSKINIISDIHIILVIATNRFVPHNIDIFGLFVILKMYTPIRQFKKRKYMSRVNVNAVWLQFAYTRNRAHRTFLVGKFAEFVYVPFQNVEQPNFCFLNGGNFHIRNA